MTNTIILLTSILIGFIGLVFAYSGLKRLVELRPVKALSLEIMGIAFLIIALVCFVLALNLYTYQQLVYEKVIAQVSFKKIENQKYLATIEGLDSNYYQEMVLQGDEWQLDAQLLIWKGYVTLLGVEPYYRLHRIAGRYTKIKDEQRKKRTVISLLKPLHLLPQKTFDFWQQAHKYKQWVDWGVDTSYGSAVYLPMSDNAQYKVALSRTGLIARPANTKAKLAIKNWIDLTTH